MKQKPTSKAGQISNLMVQKYITSFNGDKSLRIAQNALTQSAINDVIVNWERFRQINHSFSHKIPQELPATHQKASGRCWLFACLNRLRVDMAKRYHLNQFEFSQSHLFFWDKFEKANFFLENIMKTCDEPSDSRLVQHLLSKPVDDGGQWHMFVSLVNKYGLVPKSCYPETKGSSASMQVNFYLIRKLREFACILRQQAKKGKAHLRALKKDMLFEVFKMLAIHLGTPIEKFDWEFTNNKNRFHSFKNLTPKSFFKKHVKAHLDEFVCLVHSPRKITPLNKTYTVAYLGNVIEGEKIIYLNVSLKEMKSACIKALKKGVPIWFGCDTGKEHHTKLGVMDMHIFDNELIYDTQFELNKAQRMEYGISLMTHAMLFTGVNLLGNKPNRWRVENSWGDKVGQKGYYLMTDEWFDAYMFEVAVEKKYLPAKLVKLLETKPKVLPPWDPLGSLAQ